MIYQVVVLGSERKGDIDEDGGYENTDSDGGQPFIVLMFSPMTRFQGPASKVPDSLLPDNSSAAGGMSLAKNVL